MKKGIVIGIVLVLICSLGFILINKNNSKQNIIRSDIKQGEMATDDEGAKTVIDTNKKVHIQVMAPDGTIAIKTINVNERELYKQAAEQIIDIYKNEQYKDIIKLPQNAHVKGINIYNETLTVDFSKEMLDIKFKDVKYERMFIDTFVRSLLNIIPKQTAFQDIAFTVEGNRVPHLFGSANTLNPFVVK